MKKIFAQPEIMVVNVKNNDIVTESIPVGDPGSANNAEAPGMRNIFESYNSWNEGY